MKIMFSNLVGKPENILPRVMNINYHTGNGIEFADGTNSEVAAAITEYASVNRPDKKEHASEHAEEISYDNFEREVDRIAKIWFVNKFGKKMISKYAGKTMTGEDFPQGAKIIYWTNGVDHAVIIDEES